MNDWHFSRILHVDWFSGELSITLGPALWIIAFLVATWSVLKVRPWLLSRNWRVETFQLSFAGAVWTIARNRLTSQLAHEAYIELATRKAAIPFDEEHDTVVEVYDSWYALFNELRRLARRVEPDAIANDANLMRLHELLIVVLNDGLRPHLTQWQARFRRWYAVEAAREPAQAPQEIQRRYPEYGALIANLKSTNQSLASLAEDLRKLAHGQ